MFLNRRGAEDKPVSFVTPAKAGVHLAAFAKTYKWIPACAGMTLLLLLTSLPAHAADQKEASYDRVMRTGTIKCGYYQWPLFFGTDPVTELEPE